ncbi:hypothetical protein P4233_17405 [Pseudomonas aeruginosa]|nr:hypothetical protein [Pseudomonas aeruginosa]
MADLQIDDLNVASNETLITPSSSAREIPLTDKALQTVAQGRQVVRDILDGKDHRLFVVIGPAPSTTSRPPTNTPTASRRSRPKWRIRCSW